MHCQCCDQMLTDIEATRRHRKTKQFLDLCSECATLMPPETLNELDLLALDIDRSTMLTREEDYDF